MSNIERAKTRKNNVNSSSVTNNDLIIFKSICNFVQDLESEFGHIQRSLKRYARLINKTTIAHTKPISKHIDVFRQFCISNQEAILKLDKSKIENGNIQYSELVFIDILDVFTHADKNTAEIIWQHLLTISALVYPHGGARNVLKERSVEIEKEESKNDTGDTDDFLANLMGELKDKIEPGSNPMEAFSKLGQSGVVGKIMQDFTTKAEDGSLDLTKMMGSFSKMMDTIQSSAGDDMPDQVKNLMGVARNLMSSIQNPDENGDIQLPNLNLGGLIGPMMSMIGGAGVAGGSGDTQGMPNLAGMLGGLTGGGTSIEDNINNQVKKAKEEGKLPTIYELNEDEHKE